MRALLDVNIIIALLDPDHISHDKAHAWWAANGSSGWASCSISENGVVRIMSNPAYSKVVRFSPHDMIGRLQVFVAQTDHQFWPGDISLRDEKIFALDRILTARQVTDVCLLGIAASRGGRLVTFDQGITISAVRIAKPENLLVI